MGRTVVLWAALGLAALCMGGAGAQTAAPVTAPPITAPAFASADADWADACGAARASLGGYERGATPPELPFVHIQQRVIELGCAQPAAFEQPLWFAHVIRAFIASFVAQGGDWPEVRAGCGLPGRGELSCVTFMVRRHVNGDLLPALNAAGCGTRADWNRMGALVAQAAGEQGALWGLGAATLLPLMRAEVRFDCLRGVTSIP